MGEKTEDPTPRRLRRAREDGDSPISGALGQSVAFVVAVALTPAAIAATAARVSALLPRAIRSEAPALAPEALAKEVLELTVPLLFAMALTALVVGLVQSGGVIALKRLTPDLSNLSPARGLRSLVSGPRLFGLVRALVAATVVAWLALGLLVRFFPDVANTALDLEAGAFAAAALARRLGVIAALVGLALALVDLVVVRRSFMRRLRMSRDEVRREHKESEGDPELKAARERAHREMLAAQTISAVRDATVLIVNPTHRAVALSYREDADDAPRVTAQGEGDLARRMIEAAHQLGVPVVRDVPLAHALGELAVGDEIPEALYEAVAEILRDALERAASDA